jgi:mono/diheme cytochrome c family protein
MRWLWLPVVAGIFSFVIVMPRTSAQPDKPREAADPSPEFAKHVRPILATYCFGCHGPNKRRGGLNLEKFDDDAEALDQVDLWDQVRERLTAKEMPPAKSKQPNEAELRTLLAWVERVDRSQVVCGDLNPEQLAQSLSGHTNTRRLNRMEYNNTLRDLFGVDLHAGDLLPSEGGGGEGFDNAGATLFITPVLLEKYLEAAELVLSTLLPDGTSVGGKSASDHAQEAQLAAVRRRLVIAIPGPSLTPHAAAREILVALLPRAFRRPAAETEIQRYLAIFDKAYERGGPFDHSLKNTLKAVLIAPSFLLLTETAPDKPGVYELDHYELAAHLSYFLWASMPDDELTHLAANEKLHDPEVLAAQVERMMRDPRSRALADGFAAQWLGIRALGVTVRPDSKLFPEFTEELAAAMREETLRCFDAIVREDRSVLEIVDARYTFLNGPLAAHYKIAGVRGPEMRRVSLEDPRRGGVLGQASVLTVTSYPHRTSPVLRGRWILEELLGVDVPPPPPDVPVLNERSKKSKDLSFRKRLEQHRSKTECATCHSRIDPLGFGFEDFDPLGRWRTEQAGQPIDSAGKLPTGEEFKGPVELKALLLAKRRPEFLRNLARKMLGYGLARELTRVDLCVVQDCIDALERGEFRMSRLLKGVVLSYPFSHRVHEL